MPLCSYHLLPTILLSQHSLRLGSVGTARASAYLCPEAEHEYVLDVVYVVHLRQLFLQLSLCRHSLFIRVLVLATQNGRELC